MVSNKTVVICCAGEGTRLGKNTPKCLVDVCGKKVIERQLEQLKEVENIVVVVGYKGEEVEKFVKSIRPDIEVCYNYDYKTTATGASFIKGAKLADTEYVIGLDGDLIVYPNDMKNLLKLDYEYACGEKPTTEYPMFMKIDENNKVAGFSRDEGELEWAGITCLKKEHILDGAWYMCDVVSMVKTPIESIQIRAKEIDTPADLIETERWINNNYDCTNKQIIDDFFKERFSIRDPYIVSRYSSNNRDEYDQNLIMKYINSNSNVLDLGCGTGVLEKRIYNLVKHICAIDKYQEFLDKADKYDNVDYICQDIETYFSAIKFDCILLFGLTIYLDDSELERTLINVRKMLAEDGTVIIKNQWGIDSELVVDKYSEKLKSIYYGKYRKLDDMINQLERLGYETEINDIYPPELNNWDNTHEYALLCKKKNRK